MELKADQFAIKVVELRKVLAAAPSVTEVLARPAVYEAWLKKAQEALNG